MIRKLLIFLEISRVFSLPTTIFSWLVVFTYASINSGNIGYGLLCLFAICLAHLGTNVLDDYFDYKTLIKQVNFDKKERLSKPCLHGEIGDCLAPCVSAQNEEKYLKMIDNIVDFLNGKTKQKNNFS